MRLGYVRSLAGGMLELLWRTDLARDLYKPAADSNVTSTVYPTEDSHRFSARYERLGIGAWSRVATTLSWDQYRLVLDRDRLPTADKARRISESDVFSHDYGLRLEAERPLGGARLLVGLDASGRFGLRAVNRTTNYDLAGVQTNIGAFATLVGGRGPLTLSAGLRIDRVVAANDGGHFGDRRVDHVAWSGFAAASWRLAPGLEASVQGARGFRDALLSDRYYRGVSGRGFITGNPELEPESSRQLDAALRYTRGRWRVALYGYGYRIDDLIERYKQGEDYFFRNRGEAELAGVELEGACELGRGLLLQLALQSQRGTVRDDGSALDDVPPRAAILTLRRDPAARWWWFARLGAYVRDDRPGPTERVVPGYSVVDGGAGFRLSRALEIQLLGRNLLDRSFYGSADALTVWAPGRSLELSLRGVL
jgi:outer membrane receptor protein involved in Fe transport